MRIAYIGKFQKLWDEECIARSFESLGHSVLRIEERQVDEEEDTGSLSRFQSVLKQIDDFRTDIVLWAKLDTDYDKLEFQRELKKRKITTVCWIFDIYLGYPNRDFLVPHQPLFKADFVFTTDGGHDEEWQKRGVNHTVLRQGIYEPEAILGAKQNGIAEIIFVGSYNNQFPYRQKMLSYLEKKYGDRFHWYGKKNTDEVRSLNLNNLFASTKIVIGDSFYSPFYWSNRLYETLGRGGFLIFPNIEGLEKEFTYYEHLIPYDISDFEKLSEKIDYYLVHDNERKKIKMAGFDYCKENYTYKKRCEKLIETING